MRCTVLTFAFISFISASVRRTGPQTQPATPTSTATLTVCATSSDLQATFQRLTREHGAGLTVEELNHVALVIRRDKAAEPQLCKAMKPALTGINPYILGTSDIPLSCLYHAFDGEVTKDNFILLEPKLRQAVAGCQFLAMDAEFSGLEVPAATGREAVKPLAFFDTFAERYGKMRKVVSTMGLLQVGLSFFQKSGIDGYEATPWTFFLKQPRDLPFSQSAQQTLNLSENDRTKIFDHGIPLTEFKRFAQCLQAFEKPLVVYSGQWDLAFFQQNFVAPLPQTWADFKKAVFATFPNVLDLKYFGDVYASTFPGADNSSLDKMYQSLQTSLPLTGALNAHSLSNQAFHTAGYDALCTGAIYLHMQQKLKAEHFKAGNGVVRCGGLSIYKFFCLSPRFADNKPDHSLIFTVNPKLPGKNAALLGSSLRTEFTRAYKANVNEKNGVIYINFTNQNELNQFRTSAKFGAPNTQNPNGNYELTAVAPNTF